MEVIIEVPGQPVAKGRGRSVFRGFKEGHAVVGNYTPARTRNFESYARYLAVEAMRQAGLPAAIDLPVAVRVEVELQVPLSWSRRKQQAALLNELRPAGRPDLDNFVKALVDAANGIVFVDDARIVEIVATKRYSATPRAVLTVMPTGGE